MSISKYVQMWSTYLWEDSDRKLLSLQRGIRNKQTKRDVDINFKHMTAKATNMNYHETKQIKT